MYRIYTGIPFTADGQTIGVTVSAIAAIVAAFLGIMLFVETPALTRVFADKPQKSVVRFHGS
jgi:hypothetical protein